MGLVLLIGAVAGAAVAVARPAGRWLLGAVGLSAVACALLAWALVTLDFSYRYVGDTTSRATSAPLRLAGLWGAAEGSLLFFAVMVGAVGLVGLRGGSARERRVLAVVVLVLLGIDLVLANPFTRVDAAGVDGAGLVPILRHPAMLYHPPLLYLGLALTVVPFVNGSRRAALAAWVVLTVAMAAGAHWAYAEVGWGGFWAWDPVENGVLLPWLALLAVVHRARWPQLPFVLAVLGSYVTRSGTALSVHGFAEDRAVGWAFLVALAAALVYALLSPHVRSPVAAAKWLRLNNLLVAYVGVVVLFGTALPLVSRTRLAVSPRFFSLYCAPAAAAAVVLALAALYRRRNPAAVIAHAGFAILMVGMAGTTFGTTRTISLAPDETAVVAGHRLTNQGWLARTSGDRLQLRARVAVDGHSLMPGLDTYAGVPEALPEVGRRKDMLVVLRRLDRDSGNVVLDVFTRPLISLVWLGALVMALGGLVALRPLAVKQPPQTGVGGDDDRLGDRHVDGLDPAVDAHIDPTLAAR
jgi:cytochrome c-type biogenesis protein CcmF